MPIVFRERSLIFSGRISLFFSLLFPFVARQVLMTLMHRPRTERTCGTSIFISTSFHRPNNSMCPRPIPQTYCVHARSSRVNPTIVSEESFSDDDLRDYHEHVFTRLSELLCWGKRVTEISYIKVELTSSITKILTIVSHTKQNTKILGVLHEDKVQRQRTTISQCNTTFSYFIGKIKILSLFRKVKGVKFFSFSSRNI